MLTSTTIGTSLEAGISIIGSSIITQLTARKVQKLVGLFPYRLHAEVRGRSGTLDVLVKSKPLDGEVLVMVNSMAAGCGARLAAANRQW